MSVLRNILCAGFIGPQGSGKTTQAKNLATMWSVPLIRTGKMLEELAGPFKDEAAAKKGQALRQLLYGQANLTKVSAWLADIIDAIPNGRPVCSEAVYALLSARFAQADCVNGFVMDRIAMDVAEASHNDALLERLGINPACQIAITLMVSEVTIQEHMAHRRDVEGRPDDLNPAAVAARLETFYARQQPLVEYYHERGRVISVSGEASPDQVFGHIKTGIRLLKSPHRSDPVRTAPSSHPGMPVPRATTSRRLQVPAGV